VLFQKFDVVAVLKLKCCCRFRNGMLVLFQKFGVIAVLKMGVVTIFKNDVVVLKKMYCFCIIWCRIVVVVFV